MPQLSDVRGTFLPYTASDRDPGCRWVTIGEKMRVLLADDNPNVRFALAALLNRRPEVVIVGQARDAAQLLALLHSTIPDLLLLDWRLPGLVDAGSVPALREGHPDLMIVALSGRPELGHEALALGADDFVSKIDPPESLLGAIAACMARLEERQATADAH
jgi:DNA-binding NarL/FixJ family response regulator